jgi:spore coat-associated protein N
MLNKKVLISILTIGFIASIASAETWAYFTTSASTAENTIKAGTLSLSLTNGVESGIIDDLSFAATGAMPGDTDISVKKIRVLNSGNIPGKLTVTTANARDNAGMGRYITIKVGGQTVYSRGTPVEGVLVTSLASKRYVTPEVTYTFSDNGNQNAVQGDTFTFDLVFTLKQGAAH